VDIPGLWTFVHKPRIAPQSRLPTQMGAGVVQCPTPMKLPCFMKPKTFVKGMNRERLDCAVVEVEGSTPAAPQFHRFQHMGDVIYLAQWKRRRLARVEEPRRLSPPPILKKRTSTQTRVDTREIEKLILQPRSTSPQPKMKLPWSAQYPAWLDNVATKHLVGLMLVLAIVVLIIVDSTASRNHPKRTAGDTATIHNGACG